MGGAWSVVPVSGVVVSEVSGVVVLENLKIRNLKIRNLKIRNLAWWCRGLLPRQLESEGYPSQRADPRPPSAILELNQSSPCTEGD